MGDIMKIDKIKKLSGGKYKLEFDNDEKIFDSCSHDSNNDCKLFRTG